jgi:hypothetical protein
MHPFHEAVIVARHQFTSHIINISFLSTGDMMGKGETAGESIYERVVLYSLCSVLVIQHSSGSKQREESREKERI